MEASREIAQVPMYWANDVKALRRSTFLWSVGLNRSRSRGRRRGLGNSYMNWESSDLCFSVMHGMAQLVFLEIKNE